MEIQIITIIFILGLCFRYQLKHFFNALTYKTNHHIAYQNISWYIFNIQVHRSKKF